MTKPLLGKAEALFCQEALLTFTGVWKKTQLNDMRDAVTFITSEWRATRSLTSSPSIASSTSLKDKVTMDFSFFAIILNFNKMA